MKFKVAEDIPEPQELGTDTTAVVPQPFSGPKPKPKMFAAAVTAKAPAKPAVRFSTTVKQYNKGPAPPAPPVPQASTAPKEEPAPKVFVPSYIPPELEALQGQIEESKSQDHYEDAEPQPYVPEDRKGFTKFIQTRYSNFKLPPLPKDINPDACNQMTLQTYKYQAFIREYMREASPYRGVLVYHGLGSGKTCTSIAAAEALYGEGKKIIVMTPTALKENFLNEIMFCGFRHYRLKNKWVKFPFKKSDAIYAFGISPMNISQAYLDKLSKTPTKSFIWIPDLSAPEEESNYDSLDDTDRTTIRQQIYSILMNSFTFLGYTALSKKFLLDIATKDPTYFDDSIIIVDEVHNLTRLMSRKLKTHLIESKAGKKPGTMAKASKYDPITIGDWVPKEIEYERAYLFYRLLSQAKNSKIIALSGTPIVNVSVEVGILGNILHGYFKCVSDTIAKSSVDIPALKAILANHPRVNFYSIENNGGVMSLFFNMVDTGYVKYFEEGVLKGLIYDEESESDTIENLYAQIVGLLPPNTLSGKPNFSAIPLFPPTPEEFNEIFVDIEKLDLRNPVTFKKRISGLVSYYKGSKEELMPSISSDQIVDCPFSPVAIPQYTAARLKELSEDPPSKGAFSEVENLVQKETSSYRFRSRAICNFAFPKEIERPFPGSKKEIEEAAKEEMAVGKEVIGDGIDLGQTTGDVEELEAQQDDEASIPEESEEDEEKPQTTKQVLPYPQRLAMALAALKDNATSYFKMDPSAPLNEQLKTYSAKYAAIYERILKSKGSSLVYSVFKTVEGIGNFTLALDVNGFAPITLVGSDDNLQLSPETIQSFTESPGQMRYIFYKSDVSARGRQTLINIFNMRLDKLPQAIADVLRAFPNNHTGQVCRVFMITAAGAEGLSLKNVRTVHIMEPFWNKVRTDQVKGRAIRICSHSELPYNKDPTLNERTVEIFSYISTFAPGEKIDQTLLTKDDGKTSDQHILNLAKVKDQISSSFLTAMKSAAIDCNLNETENEQISCFVQGGAESDFMYDPRLDKDIITTAQGEKETIVKQRGFKLGGIDYAGVEKEGKIMLYSMQNRETMKDPLGEITEVTGKKKVTWYEGKNPKKV